MNIVMMRDMDEANAVYVMAPSESLEVRYSIVFYLVPNLFIS